MKKFIPCRKCKEINNNEMHKPEGFYFKTTEIAGQKHALLVECPHHIEWSKKNKLEKKFISHGFNSEFLDYDLEKDYKGTKSKNEIDRIIKYVSLFDKDSETIEKARRCILYLYGDNGTQKTTVANYIGKQLLVKKQNVRYVLMKSLVDKLWKSQRDEDVSKEIESLLDCDVLIVDEAFAKDKIHVWSSGSQIGYVDEFLRERINKGCGTIFISNIRPDEIENQGFSHSIEDLVLRELKKQNSLLTLKDNYFDSISEQEIPDSLF